MPIDPGLKARLQGNVKDIDQRTADADDLLSRAREAGIDVSRQTRALERAKVATKRIRSAFELDD